MNNSILKDMSQIEELTLEAEMNVLIALCDCYQKQIMILENTECDDLSEFSVFQEGFKDNMKYFVTNTMYVCGNITSQLLGLVIAFIELLKKAYKKIRDTISKIKCKNIEHKLEKIKKKNPDRYEELSKSILDTGISFENDTEGKERIYIKSSIDIAKIKEDAGSWWHKSDLVQRSIDELNDQLNNTSEEYKYTLFEYFDVMENLCDEISKTIKGLDDFVKDYEAGIIKEDDYRFGGDKPDPGNIKLLIKTWGYILKKLTGQLADVDNLIRNINGK